MDASTRLYKRLGEIPEDAADPESLDELLVCAFGAFERYYVLWRTRGGEFRQDSYDLPVALRDWLYPTDGTTRDFATLQVVFGRGEEYFASDQYSKLEYKEPEVKKPTEDGGKRRSRTVSFFRPLSGTSTRSSDSATSVVASTRSSSVSSRRVSRSSSLSYSRTDSDTSVLSRSPIDSPTAIPPGMIAHSETVPPWVGPGSCAEDFRQPIRSPQKADDGLPGPILEVGAESKPSVPKDMVVRPSTSSPVEGATRSHPLNLSTKWTSYSGYFQGSRSISKSSPPSNTTTSCTCGCHDGQSKSASKPVYTDASAQTDDLLSSPTSALQIDTSSSPWLSSQEDDDSSHTIGPMSLEDCNTTNPVFIGRMIDYFSMPGYQLGDSLIDGYDL